jgi:ATP-dependent Clp protease, protease subunit
MSNTPLTTPPPIPNIIYATLTGPIDQSMVQRVFQGLAFAINSGVATAHVLFHSAGGTVTDGIALYNYLRALPLELHLYNGGSVASVAVVSFLGAQHRYVGTHATFMIHKTYAPAALFSSSAAANAERLRGITQSLEIDDTRTRAILKTHTSLTDERLDEHLTTEVPFDANEAVQCGLVHAVREFAPPFGTKLFNI